MYTALQWAELNKPNVANRTQPALSGVVKGAEAGRCAIFPSQRMVPRLGKGPDRTSPGAFSFSLIDANYKARGSADEKFKDTGPAHPRFLTSPHWYIRNVRGWLGLVESEEALRILRADHSHQQLCGLPSRTEDASPQAVLAGVVKFPKPAPF
jgi:hypothetical protein